MFAVKGCGFLRNTAKMKAGKRLGGGGDKESSAASEIRGDRAE